MNSRRLQSSAVAAFIGAVFVPIPAAYGQAEPLTLELAREINAAATQAQRAATIAPGVPGPRNLTDVPGLQRTPRSPVTSTERAGLDDPDRGAIFLRADRLEGTASIRLEASGNVELRTRRETILADSLSYDVVADEIWGRGEVVLRRGFDWITGPELKFKRDTETGFFASPRFYAGETGARLVAREIRFLGPDKYEASDARYTTCVAPNNDWYLRSDEIEVDRLRKVGTARRATVYFLDVPIMYTPWLEFPLSNERKSGFLTPTAGSTQIRGLELATPYYFNLAPNYDATFTPRFMTKRGLQLGGQARYLFESAAGEVNGEVLPDDDVTDKTRWGFSWKHNQRVLPWLAGYVNYNRVSDAKYFADFADRIAITSQKTLPQEAGAVVNYGPWSVLTRALKFQTLQDPAAPVVPPYNMLPQIRVGYAETDLAGVGLSGIGEFTRFEQSSLAPTGNRAFVYPTARWTRQSPAWFVTARTGLHLRQYDLDRPTPAAPDRNPSVAIPITSLDAGLIFERDWHAFGTPFVQTLEPRAFYTYIPFGKQSALPVFDTALDDFNFTQLFTENRFVGNDRIGDANQLSLAVTSRLLDPETGAERLRVGVGQRISFSEQRVTLGEPPRPAGRSDVLVGVEGRLSDTWSVLGLMQYNFDDAHFDRFNAGVRYTPAPGRVLNLTYRYSRELVDLSGGLSQLKQIDVSGQWPLSANWTVVGRFNYSLPDHKALEAVAGVEYNGDCWVLRVVGQRLTTTTQQTTNSVFVQLELNGLARVGTSPLELLRRSVPGYLRTNDPTMLDRDRSLDPLPEF